jgi:dihydroorotate dehydrogenase
MYQLAKKIFFLIPAEEAHQLVNRLLKNFKFSKLIKLIYNLEDKSLETELFGLKFKNPIGLAAGFDKNAAYINEMADLGFGFIEIGTVTPKAQKGNEKPRLFRLIEDEAIINRMGFNNDGAEIISDRLKEWRKQGKNKNIIIGGNIGKNKITSNENAHLDYLSAFNALYPFVDYFVLNISSPNTPNLRELQDKEPLKRLLKSVQELNAKQLKVKPILIKIAPDISDGQLDDILEIVEEQKLSGIIATNTTLIRDNLMSLNKSESGGLSGKPLTNKSTELIKLITKKTSGKLPIIAVGGIMTAQDAIDKFNAGASLVQIYTGFIYSGPKLILDIKKALLK